MKFAQWLESQINSIISFDYFSNDGTIGLYINQKRYFFVVYDGAFVNLLKTKLDWIKQNQPNAYQKVAFMYLEKIESMVENGSAIRKEPKIINKEEPKKLIQKTLF